MHAHTHIHAHITHTHSAHAHTHTHTTQNQSHFPVLPVTLSSLEYFLKFIIPSFGEQIIAMCLFL